MGNIVVQIAEETWTAQAVHLAAALARNTGMRVVLLHLMLARNPGLLGCQPATEAPSWETQKRFEEYAMICEDYGVNCVVQPMQYESLIGALQDAVSLIHADVLFAKIPHASVEIWRKTQIWWLTRSLQSSQCKLYLVDEDVRMIEWIPRHLPDLDAAIHSDQGLLFP